MQCVQEMKGRSTCISMQITSVWSGYHDLLRWFNGTVHSEPCELPKCTINYISLQIDSLIISTLFPGKFIPAERWLAGDGNWTFSFVVPGYLTRSPSLNMEDIVCGAGEAEWVDYLFVQC